MPFALFFGGLSKKFSKLYEGGQQPCLFTILLMGSARDIFHNSVKRLLNLWIDEMARVLIEFGLDKEQARQRGEDAMIAIQGALVVPGGRAFL
jgi:TetR/AcrR family transcriptional regulator, lmrAB and yxaGH operons repressor